MFKAHRFNPSLKAEPNNDHQETVSKKLVHGHAHEKLQQEVTQTTTRERGGSQTIKEVKETDVITKHTTRGDIREITEVDVVVKSRTDDRDGDGSVIDEVHATVLNAATIEMIPPYASDKETPAYKKAHHHLVYKLDSPCALCGVRYSTLHDPKENPFGATVIETHHYPIERHLTHACDPRKVRLVFPEVDDFESMEAFVDSEHNLMVLCDIHHRHVLYGIHHLTSQDFFIQPFLWKGYQIAATEDTAGKVGDKNQKILERIEKRLDIEFEEH